MIALLATLALAQEPPVAPGLYRLDAVIATESKVPFQGRVTVVNASVALARLDRGPDGWTQDIRLCAVEVTDDSKLATTTIPDAFVAATPVQAFPVRFVEEGGTWRYHADPGPLDVGWDPVAAGGVLPSKPGDPGVVDFEGDGAPGATVRLTVPVFNAIDLYVVQRGHSVYSGTVRDGAIEGPITVVTLEQRTIDATNSWFRSSVPTRVLPEGTTFRLTPVPDGTTCDTV